MKQEADKIYLSVAHNAKTIEEMSDFEKIFYFKFCELFLRYHDEFMCKNGDKNG